MSQDELRNDVNDVLMKLGAFKVGVADPQKGFAQALDGCHPRDKKVLTAEFTATLA